MTQPTAPAASQQRGLPYALGAYAIWGFVPLFFKLLTTVPPVEVLAQRIVWFDQWVMLAAAVLLLVFLYTGRRLSRIEGGVLLLGYVAYVGANFFVPGLMPA